MKSFTDKLLNFAGGEQFTQVYRQFVDYFNHYKSNKNGGKTYDFQKEISFSEKEEQMNVALRREILRKANMFNLEQLPIEQLVTNPMVNWATFAVINQLVDLVIPDSLIESIGLYTDTRFIDFGDSSSFEIKPRDLFVVSKAGRGMREGEVHRQFDGMVTILPTLRELTTQVSLYKVLSGKESLAEFVAKVVQSLESEMARDTYVTFNTAMGNLSTTGNTKLLYAGYSQADLVTLAQKVGAWNGGAKPVIVGTAVALLSVLPDNGNYRYAFDSDYVKVGYINTISNYDVMVLPQVADWATPFSLLLDDTRIYVVSPSANKLVKLVVEGSTMSNVGQPFQNATLQQNATLYKSWGSAIKETVATYSNIWIGFSSN